MGIRVGLNLIWWGSYVNWERLPIYSMVIKTRIGDFFVLRIYLFSKAAGMSKQNLYEKAQGLVEYMLILVLVAVVVIISMRLLGPIIGNVFSNIITALNL
jgi:pilus assembly protein Flp/PilA